MKRLGCLVESLAFLPTPFLCSSCKRYKAPLILWENGKNESQGIHWLVGLWAKVRFLDSAVIKFKKFRAFPPNKWLARGTTYIFHTFDCYGFFFWHKYSFHFVSSNLIFIIVCPLVCFRVVRVCIGCFHMMSLQKGPQSSSFNFCILQQNKSSRKISWWYSVFTHKYGSLNLIYIMAGLGKITFYFIDENQDHCKAESSKPIPNERSHALIKENPDRALATLLSIHANKIAFLLWTQLRINEFSTSHRVWQTNKFIKIPSSVVLHQIHTAASDSGTSYSVPFYSCYTTLKNIIPSDENTRSLNKLFKTSSPLFHLGLTRVAVELICPRKKNLKKNK